MIRVLPIRHGSGVNVTTRSDEPWARALSPMLLGPVPLYGKAWAKNVENAWQFSKLYPEHAANGWPTGAHWRWARQGWDDDYAHRYPLGRGRKPLCSTWAGEQLDYIEARKRIYIPLYAQAVRMFALPSLQQLRERLVADDGELTILDFDAYDHHALGYSWADVVNDPGRKMGHGFVLAMMLDGYL